MGKLLNFVNFLMQLINELDKVLCFIGIRLYPLTRSSILWGLPESAAEELEKPDIKLQADTIFEDEVSKKQINLTQRFILTKALQEEVKNRLLINQYIKAIPEIKKVPIKKPLFIIGPQELDRLYYIDF